MCNSCAIVLCKQNYEYSGEISSGLVFKGYIYIYIYIDETIIKDILH